jgi:transposase
MGRKSKELSEDRKQLVVDLKREGHRNCEIVKLLHIPESTIRSIWKKYNSTGFFLLQRKTLVTISTRTTDRSHFLIFANTYEAAL